MGLTTSLEEIYDERNLPFVQFDDRGVGDFFAIRPTYNYGIDNAVGMAAARALIEDLRKNPEGATFGWVMLAMCERFNKDYRGIVVGFAEELSKALLSKGARH